MLTGRGVNGQTYWPLSLQYRTIYFNIPRDHHDHPVWSPELTQITDPHKGIPVLSL